MDNGSTNDSIARIRAAHPWVHLEPLPANLGFPGGCNAGTRIACAMKADLIWLLNNDTVAPPDTASKLVARSQADPQAGLIGAVLYDMDDPARVQAWGGGTINRWTGYNRHYLRPARLGSTSYITFASALIPRAAWDQVGDLYEGAFMYFEDVDFSFRVRAAGWHLAVAETTAILHREGSSTAAQSSIAKRYRYDQGGSAFPDPSLPRPAACAHLLPPVACGQAAANAAPPCRPGHS